MSSLQKLTFEYVSPLAHPEAYHGSRPAMRPDEVPEHWWTPAEPSVRDDVSGQYQGLLILIEQGELVRNVRRYRAVQPDPAWVVVP